MSVGVEAYHEERAFLHRFNRWRCSSSGPMALAGGREANSEPKASKRAGSPLLYFKPFKT